MISQTNQSQNAAQSVSSNTLAESIYIPNNKLYRELDLKAYCRKHNVPEEGERFLQEASIAPARRANGFRSNTVLMPAPEYGYALTAESTSLECACFLIARARPDVIRIYNQGPKQKIQATTPEGTTYTISLTVDAILLTETGVEVIELENLEESASYYLKAKNRYELVDGRYTSPPVEAYFAKWRFKFSILSEDNLDARFAQNARFIHPYQVGHARDPIKDDEKSRLLAAVSSQPGIFLTDIQFDSAPRRAEIAYHLIASGELFTHLSECPLEKPDRIRLFPTPQKERAFLLLREATRRQPADLKSLGYLLETDSLIDIAGKEYRVGRVGVDELVLIDPKGVSLPPMPHQALLDLKPRIGGIYNAEKTFEAILAEASPEDMAELQYRQNSIAPYLMGGAKAAETPHDRNVRRWRDAFLEAKRKFGIGLAGIFPGHYRSGNREPRMNDQVETLITHVIDKYYLKPAGNNVTDCHLHILAIGQRLKIPPSQLPSYSTIARRCAAIDPYKKAFRRFGKRAAHKFLPIHRGKSPLGSPHGDKSFAVAHCDSTQLDLAITHDNQVIEIKHLWHTKMVDAFDLRVLATHTSEAHPSADTLQALISKCVEIHGAIPAQIVVDWGTEHKNVWVERTLTRIGVTILYRPKAKPVAGTTVETHFAKLAKELIHNCAGNTKLMKEARQVTKAVDPRNHTIWSEALVLELLAVYYQSTNNRPRKNRPSPNAIAAASYEQFGPPPVQVADVKSFLRMLLPYVDRIHRMVSNRGTIRCNHYTFGHDDLRIFAGTLVDVRVDRKEPRLVYVDHPTQRRVIECTVVSTDLKYADDTADAVRMVNEAAAHRQTSAQEIQASRVEFTGTLIDLTEQAEAEEKARRTKPKRPTKEATSQDTAEPLAPIIPLTLETII